MSAFLKLKQKEVEPSDPVSLAYSKEMLKQFKEGLNTDKSSITIKTFQKERSPVPVEGQEEGSPVVNFDAVQWPESNFIPLTSFTDGQEVKLATYRYPSLGKRKGIISYLHGYGDYCKRYAYFAQHLAT